MSFFIKLLFTVSELIDTLWNVNAISVLIPSWLRELIDTLWNVNVAIKGFLCKFQRN